MKKMIDANVILRYLLNDNLEMAAQAETIIQEGACTLPEIIAEVLYVLKGVYHAERSDISDYLTQILDLVYIENKEILKSALALYGHSTLDFPDCILISYNWIRGQAIFSFDKKLNKELRTI